MTNFLKGNTPATIYKQLIAVGTAADHAGLTASLKQVFTDDGAGGATASAMSLSTAAVRVTSNNQLQFGDTGTYVYQSSDGTLAIVADGEIDLATAVVDVNATTSLALDNTNTSNGITINTATSGSPVSIGHTTSETTVNDNLTVTGTTAHSGVVTMASGIKLQFVDGGEYLSGTGTNLTVGSGGDISLEPTANVNLVGASKKLTFAGNDNNYINCDGSNQMAVAAAAKLDITAGAASTWKTTAGALIIDAEASTVEIDGHSGVQLQGNAAEVDITTTGAVDINSAGFTLDGTTLSIDGTDDSNITVTGSGKDLNLEVAGGGAQQLTLESAGTGADALTILTTAGGIDITSTGTAADEDIDIRTASSINLSSTENVADSIVLNSSYGGIDILASGASAGEDIDITATGSSVNISATENAANAIYLHADGGTSETIKIHADQGTADTSIYLLSDAGSVTIDSGQTSSDKGVLINTATSGGKTYIGHTTSETTVNDNLTVTGTLTAGSISYTALTLSHATATVLTLDNQEHSDSDSARDILFKFTGEKGSGASVDDMAQILVAHDGSSSDEKGFIDFKTNSGSEGTSPSSALKLSADNTATFTGAIAAGTNAITCGQLNADNIRLDGNTMTSTDSNGDITLTPNGTGGVALIGAAVAGDYAVAAGASASASANYGTALGQSCTASGVNSTAMGLSSTASGVNSFALGNTCQATQTSSYAFGLNAKADRKGEISHSANKVAAVGDTRGSFFHTFADLTMSSSWQSLVSGTGGVEFDADSVACGSVLVVGSTAGATVTVGYIVEFIAENDGGSYAIVGTPVVRTHETEDTSLDCQVAVSSSALYIQVTDSASTPTMRWSAHWHIVQHTYAAS